MNNPDEKKEFVKEKFSSISKDYDFLNTILSFHIDRYWRWLTTRMLRDYPEGTILDLCAGTLPLALELTRQAPKRQVLAVDFCEDMLLAGINNLPDDERKNRIIPICGDGEKIPVANESCWGITVAFGVRNLSRTQDGIKEMYRVLKPRGRLVMSDPICDMHIPDHLREDDKLRALCLSGSMPLKDYIKMITDVGFGTVEIRAKRPYRILSPNHYDTDENIY